MRKHLVLNTLLYIAILYTLYIYYLYIYYFIILSFNISKKVVSIVEQNKKTFTFRFPCNVKPFILDLVCTEILSNDKKY